MATSAEKKRIKDREYLTELLTEQRTDGLAVVFGEMEHMYKQVKENIDLFTKEDMEKLMLRADGITSIAFLLLFLEHGMDLYKVISYNISKTAIIYLMGLGKTISMDDYHFWKENTNKDGEGHAFIEKLKSKDFVYKLTKTDFGRVKSMLEEGFVVKENKKIGTVFLKNLEKKIGERLQ